jgi:uncharacterized protein with HEPN domain
MSARQNDDRRVAEIWETCKAIADRIESGIYTKDNVIAPKNGVEEALGESLAYALRRIGEEASRMSFEAKTIAPLPWDSIVGLRNVLSRDYPGISWQQIWSTASEDLSALEAFCIAYARKHKTTIDELVEMSTSSIKQIDEVKTIPPTHRWDSE